MLVVLRCVQVGAILHLILLDVDLIVWKINMLVLNLKVVWLWYRSLNMFWMIAGILFLQSCLSVSLYGWSERKYSLVLKRPSSFLLRTSYHQRVSLISVNIFRMQFFSITDVHYIFIQQWYWCFAAATMSALYEEHKDEDGFLYMAYSGESTFGSR